MRATIGNPKSPSGAVSAQAPASESRGRAISLLASVRTLRLLVTTTISPLHLLHLLLVHSTFDYFPSIPFSSLSKPIVYLQRQQFFFVHVPVAVRISALLLLRLDCLPDDSVWCALLITTCEPVDLEVRERDIFAICSASPFEFTMFLTSA